MRVCFVPIDFHMERSGGGIASYVHVMGNALLERGHEVTIVAKGDHRSWAKVDGFDVLFWPLGSLHWYWYRARLPPQVVLPVRELEWSLGIRRAMHEVESRLPVDVIEGCETGNLFISDLKAPLVLRLHGEPYVFAKYSHQPLHWGLRLTRRLEFVALRRASGVTSPSRFQAQEVAQSLGWPRDRIRAIPNPIAPWILDRAIAMERSNADRQSPIVLYTGRIEYRKGTIPLLRSVPHVAPAFPNVRYVIAGGRHTSIDDRTLNDALDENNARDHVTLLGHIPWKDLVDWYARAAVFVMPSFFETFGISCLEAMAFGLPVVATRASALPEVVEDGVTGILVPPGDPEALAEAITRLLRDPGMCHRMGQRGRQRVLEEFTVEQVLEQTMNVYRKAIAQA